MKRISKKILLVSFAFFSLTFHTSFAQQNNTVYTYNPKNENHPDGVKSKIGIDIQALYHSIKMLPTGSYVGKQSLDFSINWVLHDKFVHINNFSFIKEDSSRYMFLSGVKYYLTNPITSQRSKNPDGVVGSPSIQLSAGLRFDSNSDTDNNSIFKAELHIPIAKKLSVFTGITNYKELEPTDSDEFFGGISIYFSKYTKNNPYDNPDSPDGSFGVKLIGGSSKVGGFGEIDLIIPASNSFTVNIIARSDFLDSPFDKIYSGGLKLSYYKGK